MIVLAALTWAVAVGCATAVWASYRSLERSWLLRTGIGLLLAVVGLNTQLHDELWGSLILVVLLIGTALLPGATVRTACATLLAVAGSFILDPGGLWIGVSAFFTANATRIALVVLGFLLATIGGSAIVELLLGGIKRLPHSSEEAEGTRGAPAGGQVIGILERAFSYGGVLLGHPEAVALVVAVKSAARFPEFKGEHGRRFAEYFLIGTLVSTLFAIATAYLIGAGLSLAPCKTTRC